MAEFVKVRWNYGFARTDRNDDEDWFRTYEDVQEEIIRAEDLIKIYRYKGNAEPYNNILAYVFYIDGDMSREVFEVFKEEYELEERFKELEMALCNTTWRRPYCKYVPPKAIGENND